MKHLTPVERMNEAIRIMVTLGWKAKEMHQHLVEKGYEIDLMQVLSTIASLNYKHQMPHKPSPADLRRQAFNRAIGELIEPLVKYHLPYSYMLSWLHDNNVKHPSTLKPFKTQSLKKYLIDHRLYRQNKSICRTYCLTYAQYCDKIDLSLPERLKNNG